MAGTVAMRPKMNAEVTVEKCILTEGLARVKFEGSKFKRLLAVWQVECKVESIDKEENRMRVEGTRKECESE